MSSTDDDVSTPLVNGIIYHIVLSSLSSLEHRLVGTLSCENHISIKGQLCMSPEKPLC